MRNWATPEEFLMHYHLPIDTFNSVEITWDELLKIAKHHKNRDKELSITASHIASKLLLNHYMHSVRWRIKDPEHLMAKILRKQLSQNEKYQHISVENYAHIITDLIGIRVLHLFKDDALMLDTLIREKYHFYEKPTYFYRLGDDTSYLSDELFTKKEHDIGYRSIHYIIETGDKDDKTYVEIQVRTLFEEGWSEIDHLIRYPNFSNDSDIEHFLKLFNTAASFADEMGNSIRIIKRIKDQKAKQTMRFIDQLIAVKSEVDDYDQRIADCFESLEQNPSIEKINELRTIVHELKEDRRRYTDSFLKLHDIHWKNTYYQVADDVSSERRIKGNAIIPLCRDCAPDFRIISVGEETELPCYNCGQVIDNSHQSKYLPND